MPYFTYHQNNSGGAYKGSAEYVIIEADNAEEANCIAEENGLYFNGCATGQDCPCCGDRWIKAYDYDATDQPKIYSDVIKLDQKVYQSPYSLADRSSILIIPKNQPAIIKNGTKNE